MYVKCRMEIFRQDYSHFYSIYSASVQFFININLFHPTTLLIKPPFLELTGRDTGSLSQTFELQFVLTDNSYTGEVSFVIAQTSFHFSNGSRIFQLISNMTNTFADIPDSMPFPKLLLLFSSISSLFSAWLQIQYGLIQLRTSHLYSTSPSQYDINVRPENFT